jgi:hypothetical protein
MEEDVNRISEVARRDIFDSLRLSKVSWEGRLSETDFLSRVFDLTTLPSHDSRASNMLADVSIRREHFHDWADDWVYDDGRLNLLRAPDATFLRFLCEMIHPVVRASDADVDRLLAIFNDALAPDQYQLVVKSVRSGRRIFTAALMLPSTAHGTQQARLVADALESGHVMDQITRMEASIISDPALAIGSAKEFLETLCKAILAERGTHATGKENLPKLVHETRKCLGLTINPQVDETLRSTLGALATLTQGIAELRGQLGTGHGASPTTGRPPVEIARLAVGVATALGVFFWETHQAKPNTG